jgi:hypothetical protein
MIIVYTILFFWIAGLIWMGISYLIFRKKYTDKKTGWKKCCVCGKTPSEIYFNDDDRFLNRHYYCSEHKKDLKK